VILCLSVFLCEVWFTYSFTVPIDTETYIDVSTALKYTVFTHEHN